MLAGGRGVLQVGGWLTAEDRTRVFQASAAALFKLAR